MSMPPAALTMNTGFLVARSTMMPTYASLPISSATVTSTFSTVRPLMSMPRIAVAFSRASAGVVQYFTPPALPRPPTCTCAFTITADAVPRRASASAASGVVAMSPVGIGTPGRRRISLA